MDGFYRRHPEFRKEIDESYLWDAGMAQTMGWRDGWSYKNVEVS
jgi:hypothetical protein